MATKLAYMLKAHRLYKIYVLLMLSVGICFAISYGAGKTIIYIAQKPSSLIQETLYYKGSPVFKIVSEDNLTRALEYSIAIDNQTLAMELINSGARINRGPGDLISPLFHAAAKGNLVVGKLLITKGADINDFSEPSFAFPVMGTIIGNQPEFLKLLIQHGADVNRSYSPEHTPLSRAKDKKQKEIIEILTAAGARMPASPSSAIPPK